MRGSAMLLLGVLGLAASVLPAAEQCGVCHPESRVAYADSVHAREGVGCSECHGGDPQSRDPDAAHRGGFRGLGDRLRIPQACAECHSDIERMRPYNLPVDQLAVYLTSQHGQAIARGERRSAICSDCHGSHRVLASADPSSPVHHRRVAETCGRCHGDAALMAQFGLDPDVVDEYRAGVHGVALLEEGRTAAPDCTSCHGVHGAAPPGFGDVDKVCGACHAETRAAYLEGPHHEAMRAAGLPECASCHAHHAVRRLDAAAIEEQCEECHGAGSKQAQLGRQLYTLVRSAAEEVDAAEELTERAQRAALHVEDHLSRIEEARTYLTEALPLVHTLGVETVEGLTRRARSISEEVRHELYRKLDRRPAHLGLVVFWFYLLLTVAVLTAYKRRLAGRRE